MNRKDHSPVNSLYIASPCSIDFESMEGDERVRFCNLCQKNVYNIAKMTSKEAENLIQETEGKFCARLYLRPDGTVITDNCPVALRKLRSQWLKIAAAVAILVPCLAFLQSVSAQVLVGAPVDPRYGQSGGAGYVPDFGYDQAPLISRTVTALSTIPAIFFGLPKIIRALKQPELPKWFKLKAAAVSIAILLGIPVIVHLIGTFIINNYGGLGGGL